MALIFIESFNKYALGGSLIGSGGWATGSAIQSLNTSYCRFNGIGILCGFSSNNLTKDFTATATYVIGLAIKVSGTPTFSTSYPFLQLYDADGADTQLTFFVDSSFQILAYRGFGSTLLGTSTPAWSGQDVYAFIEIKVVINSSTGSVEVRSNGTTILSLTSQNTQTTANAYVTRSVSKFVYNQSTYMDDIYMDDSDFHGDCVVKSYAPTADGSYTDFTPSAGDRYACIDDSQGHDSDSTYIYAADIGDKNSYQITTGALNTVEGIQITNEWRLDDAGSKGVKPLIRSNGSDYLGSQVDLSSSYARASYVVEVDPDDSNPWTQAKLEAAEFGVEITA